MCVCVCVHVCVESSTKKTSFTKAKFDHPVNIQNRVLKQFSAMKRMTKNTKKMYNKTVKKRLEIVGLYWFIHSNRVTFNSPLHNSKKFH